MKRTTILIADGHPVVIEGLRRILDRPEFKVVGEARDGRVLLQAAIELQPDVIITGVAMPLLNGIEAARKIHEQNPKPKIIFLTMYADVAYATAALTAGASGYVLKSSAGEELIKAIHDALKGRIYVSKSMAKSLGQARKIRLTNVRSATDLLSHRQLEVLQLLAEGKQAKEIAAVLKLSPRTVEFHKYRIMDLLGLRTVADLARYAVKRGLVK